MNKSLIKFITDFGPLLIFYAFYKKYGMEEAIIPLIIATAISVIVIYLTEKRIPAMPLIGAILVAGFGGLAIYFNDKTFFYMKPTIINLMFQPSSANFKLSPKTFFNKDVFKINCPYNKTKANIKLIIVGFM